MMEKRYAELAKMRASRNAERAQLVELQKIAESTKNTAIRVLQAEKLLYPALADDIEQMIKSQITVCSKATRNLQKRIEVIDLIYH